MLDCNRLARPAPIVILLVLVTMFLYWPTVLSLYQTWTNPSNPTYSHGLLLVTISAILLYRRWKNVPIELNASPWGLLALAATSFAWLLAYLGQVLIVQQLSLLGVIGLLLWAVLGYRSAKKLAFPLLLLLFAIPFWEFLSVRLQYFTASAVTFLLNNSGFTAILDDVFILVPAGAFEVTTSCSGLAQFIVATMVAVLYSYLNALQFRKALLLTAVAMLVAIVSNTVRIYTVVVAGQLTSMQHYFVTKDHWTLGWVLFGTGMFIFVLWADRYMTPEIRTVSKPGRRSLRGLRAPTNPDQLSAAVALRTAPLALGALALGPVLAHVYAAQQPMMLAPNLTIPAQIGLWHSTGVGTDRYRPSFHGADVEYDRLYRAADGAEVYLYVGYYARQEQGKEAVYYLNNVYDGKQWLSAGEKQVSLGSPESLRVKETRVQSKDGGTKIVWQWYYANRSRTSNDYMAKILNIIGTLRRHPGIAVIVIAADVNENIEEARSRLIRFVSGALEKVEQRIDAIEST